MKPIISLCMIVKNEEKVIDRCLSSIAHLVDEVIVVDTGSTDKTKEYVKKYTTNIFDFNWIGDFSAARNFAASKANGEWILVLDADEYVDEENFQEFLREIVKDNDLYDCYSAKIINFTGEKGESIVQNHHDRIYKNDGTISYYRKIHEQFHKSNNVPLRNKIASLNIFHSGYLKSVSSEKEKHQRNKKLLGEEMESGEINAFDYFNFGNEYFSLGDYTKALESYLKAYKEKRDFRLSWVSTTLVQIILCLLYLKRFNEALSVANDAEIMYPNSPEFPYLKGEVFISRGQVEDAKRMFYQILNNANEYSHIVLRPDYKDRFPHSRLGDIYFDENNYEKCIHHYVSVLNINKYCDVSINRVVYILNKFHNSEEISSFFLEKKLIDSNNLNIFTRTCFEVGKPEIVLPFLNSTEDNKLLYQVARLKINCINNIKLFEDIDQILNLEIMSKLIHLNWINVVDLQLFKELAERETERFQFIKEFERDNNFSSLINVVNGIIDEKIIDENLFLFSLETSINYKKFNICNELLKNLDRLASKCFPKVANVLFKNGFKAEALTIYEKCDWQDFNPNDFINIINSLLETNNFEAVLEVAKYAKMVFVEDFRFYKYILDYCNDKDFSHLILIQARDIFKESIYLERYAI